MKQHLSNTPGPIGVFDSGYGGLTILDKIREVLPEYDYIYLGDNARAPYGTRSFEVVYEFTRQAVNKLFDMGCHLVILACNTASAKALRSIQMNDLPGIDPARRVLGVIRPTVECVGEISKNQHIGVLATAGTIKSESYPLEIHKLFPEIQVSGTAFSKSTYPGTVTYISPSARQQYVGSVSETVVDATVTLDPSSLDDSLRMGLSAKASVVVNSQDDALIVPYDCILQDENNKEFVYVYQEGRALRRDIVTGEGFSDGCLVSSGLSRGDRVVMEPGLVKKDGEEILPKEAAA